MVEGVDCIVLAGGLGTRLRDTVPNQPKPLASINGTPFLEILLRQLTASQLVKKTVLAIGYKAEAIVEHFSGTEGIEFSIEQEPLGTGGAVQLALSHTISNPVLVINGDSFLDFSLEQMLLFHEQKKAGITMAYTHVENADRFGRLEIDSHSQRILSFREKAEGAEPGPINGGVYLIQRNLLIDHQQSSPFSLEKEFFSYVEELYGFPCSGTFIDIGTRDSYFAAQRLLPS